MSEIEVGGITFSLEPHDPDLGLTPQCVVARRDEETLTRLVIPDGRGTSHPGLETLAASYQAGTSADAWWGLSGGDNCEPLHMVVSQGFTALGAVVAAGAHHAVGRPSLVEAAWSHEFRDCWRCIDWCESHGAFPIESTAGCPACV